MWHSYRLHDSSFETVFMNSSCRDMGDELELVKGIDRSFFRNRLRQTCVDIESRIISLDVPLRHVPGLVFEKGVGWI